MHEMLSNKSVKLGIVKIIRTPGEVVHGKELLSHERKVLVRDVSAQQLLNPMMNLFLVPTCELTNCPYVNFRFKKRIQRKKEEATKFIHHQQNGQKVRERWKRIQDRLMCHCRVKWSLPRQWKMWFSVADSSNAKCFRTTQEKCWVLGDINEQNAYLLPQIKSSDKKVKKLKMEYRASQRQKAETTQFTTLLCVKKYLKLSMISVMLDWAEY